MDLISLGDQLNACFESSSDVHQLYQIILTFKADPAVKERLGGGGGATLPPLIARAIGTSGESLGTILKAVPIQSPQDAFQAVFRWLELVLYTTCEYIPFLNEKSAQNLAIGHPVSIWLFKEHRTVEACYYIGMFLVRKLEKKELPVALVKLPELVERFRVYVLPRMVEFHTSAIDQLKKVNSEYMEL